MSRSRRRRRRSGGGATAQIVLGVLLLVACTGGVGAFVWLSLTAEHRPTLSSDTLCPVEGPKSVTVVLLDASDAIPDIGRRQITTFLQDLADGMPDYGLLEMRLLDPQMPGGRIVFAKCNPGDGSNLSELTAAPALVRKRWAEAFQGPVRKALAEGMNPAEAASSPIMETIQSIAVDRFEGNAAKDVPKRLILVSDMIEHGSRYSQYKDGTSFEEFQRKPAHRALATDLDGAEVTIRFIQREGSKIGSAAHYAFWERWFEENGGRIVDAEKVQGAG